MNSEIKKSKYYTDISDYENDVDFYEEFTVLVAQEKIAKLMEEQKISKTKLAKLLNQSKAHVTGLLSDGRNLTLKTFGRVCFYLNAKIEDFEMSSIRVNNKNIYEQIQDNINFRKNYQSKELKKSEQSPDFISKSFKGINDDILNSVLDSNTKEVNSYYKFEDGDDFRTRNNVA